MWAIELLERFWLDQVVTRFTPYQILCVGTFLVVVLTFMICNLPYVLIETYWQEWAFKYKVQPDERNDPKEVWAWWWRCLLQQLFPLPLFLMSMPLLTWAKLDLGEFKATPSELLLQFVVYNLAGDTMFYWTHRFFHTRWAYEWIHHVHHRSKAPYSLRGLEAHPIETLLGFVAPTVVPLFLWSRYIAPVHVLVFWSWSLFREIIGTEVHTGYDFPWQLTYWFSMIGYNGRGAHDIHHSQIRYNFGSFRYWDLICGTHVPPVPPPAMSEGLGRVLFGGGNVTAGTGTDSPPSSPPAPPSPATAPMPSPSATTTTILAKKKNKLV